MSAMDLLFPCVAGGLIIAAAIIAWVLEPWLGPYSREEDDLPPPWAMC